MIPSTLFWTAYPFPHYVIDNFIPPEIFKKLSDQDTGLELPYIDRNLSDIEKNKTVSHYTTNALEQYAYELLTGRDMLDTLRGDLLNNTLLSSNQFPLQYCFHKSYRGAKLGCHLDQSELAGKVHILNAIYYCHQEWYSSWGGYTLLYDKWGNEVRKIEPRPNRLLLLFNDSNSFHGCSEVFCPSDSVRKSIYVGYYTARCTLVNIILDHYAHAHWWEHKTTFVPVIGSGKFFFYLRSWLQYKWNKYRKVIQ